MPDAPVFDLRLDKASLGAQWTIDGKVWMGTKMGLSLTGRVLNRLGKFGSIDLREAELDLALESQPGDPLESVVTFWQGDPVMLDGQGWRLVHANWDTHWWRVLLSRDVLADAR